MVCSRMSILRVFNVKNHSVESGFFADFERFWMSKNDNLDLQILGQKVEIKYFKILYSLAKGPKMWR